MNEVRGLLRIKRFGDDGRIASLSAYCPACDFEHSFRVDLDGHGSWDSVWSFDGDWECPTFDPSMGSNMHRTYEDHPVCHSFLRAGKWEYLNDSTHKMAGQVVEVPPPDPAMSFHRQHGWHLFSWTDDNGNPLPTEGAS